MGNFDRQLKAGNHDSLLLDTQTEVDQKMRKEIYNPSKKTAKLLISVAFAYGVCIHVPIAILLIPWVVILKVHSHKRVVRKMFDLS